MVSIVLVRPQMGENIGAAARAMFNFGLSDLRIVSPRDGWPNEQALAMSAGAKHLIESAKIYDNLKDALADKQFVYATTARNREVEKQVVVLQDIKQDFVQNSAIIFGPERTGLTNEDISLCDAILTIPVNPEYPSLNLAQAVALVCYELSTVIPAKAGIQNEVVMDSSLRWNDDGEIAEKAKLYHLFDFLESELEKRNFWQVPQKKEKMCNNIRNMLTKAELTEQEVNTMFGIIRNLTER